MEGLVGIIIMSATLAAAAFGIGMIPIYFTISNSQLNLLSIFGNGLLLGTALGVVIPEGIETVHSTLSVADSVSFRTALSLLSGFAFMLIIEQSFVGHSHDVSSLTSNAISLKKTRSAHPLHNASREATSASSDHELDRMIDDLEESVGSTLLDDSLSGDRLESTSRAFPLTFGLVVHSLADGLALGASALPKNAVGDSAHGSELSLLIFLSLIIHKAPAALALSTSLLSNALSRSECRRHLIFFSLSTPLGALMSFGILTFLGGEQSNWPGIALLVSGGTFLYVATILQPISNSHPIHEGLISKYRAMLICAGMFLPLLLSRVFRHTH